MSGQSSKKACLMVHSCYDPDLRARWFSKLFLEEKYQVEAFALRTDKYADYYWEEIYEDVYIWRLMNSVPIFPRNKESFQRFKKMFEALNRQKYDYYYVANFRYLIHLYFYCKKKKRGN